MSGLLAGMLLALAIGALPCSAEDAARHRLARIPVSALGKKNRYPETYQAPRSKKPPRLAWRRLAALLVGIGLFLVVGGASGLILGLGASVALNRWLVRLEPRAARARREQIAADLPLAADLLAACLLVGCSPKDAVTAVADAVGGPLGAALRGVVHHLRLGGDIASSWLRLADEPALACLARGLARAADSGAPLAETASRIADDQRGARRWHTQAQAQRASLRAVLPLGVCFLPAFVLLGVVPLIVGLTAQLI